MATFTGGPYRFVRLSGLARSARWLLALRRRRLRLGRLAALDPVASAADRTLDKGTGRFDLQMKFSVPAARTGDGHRRGHVRQREAGDGRDYERPGCRNRTPSSVELRLLYPAMYVHTDGLLPMGAQLPNGKSWVKIDVERALNELGVELRSQLGVGQSPTDVLAWLRGSTDAKKVGDGDDRRRATRRITACTINAQDALARATPKERKALSGSSMPRRRRASTRPRRRSTSGSATTGSCAG